MTALPLMTCCARPTDECVCGVIDDGNPCGNCDAPSVFELPERLQPYREPYLIEERCEACGYTFPTDTREGR